MNKPELLCPAGSMEQLKAAVAGGCDAVYFGGSSFNARINAKNFDNEKIIEAVNFCRLFGVKVYITLNTLLSDRQLPDVLEYVGFLEKNCTPDAYIIQDIGLMRAIHGQYSQTPLHASTQMALHSAGSIELLKKYGVTRIICAREMSGNDIREVSKSFETEVFVHGALCVSQSGGCLFSSMVAKNSGNAGKCAQPCRLQYKSKEPYPLSLKDNCLANHIVELISCGVASFKIEGRMKDPSYVYTVASVYRRLIDERRNITGKELEALLSSFSRSGFTDGYFIGKPSNLMFGVRTEADKEKTRCSIKKIPEPQIPIKLSCTIQSGKPAVLAATAKGVSFTCSGETPAYAISMPLTKETVIKSICKLGNTVFSANTAEVELWENANLPVSALNSLRREAIEGLTAQLIVNNSPKRIPEAIETPNEPEPAETEAKSYDVVRFEGEFLPDNPELLGDVAYIDIPLWRINGCFAVRHAPDKIRVLLPRVVFPSEEKYIRELLTAAKSKGIKHAVIRNLGQLPLCDGFIKHGDLTLNLMNNESMKVLAGELTSAVISPEATKAGFRQIKNYIQKELVVYGKLPLMHTEACIIRRVNGSCKNAKGCSAYLTDRIGERFYIHREISHRSVIYNSVPLWLLDEKLVETGRLFCFTDEKESDIKKILDGRINEAVKPQKMTRGYFR